MDHPDPPAPDPASYTTTRRVLVTLCATCGTGLYSFTWNSVTVALPRMQGSFSATTDQIAWMVIAFIIGSVTMTACIGWFADQFGRKRMYLIAIAGFSATLIGCGFSTTIEQAVGWRFLQGMFGAALIPIGQAIAVSVWPRERHGQATSLWALGFVSANVVAPSVAGVIVEGLGWPWIFFITFPAAIVVFVACWILVPVTPRHQRPLDWLGFVTLIVGVSFLQLMLARGQRLDWFDSTEIIIEAGVAIICLYIFVVHTITAKNPFYDRSLFTDRNFTMGQFYIFLLGSSMFLPLLLLPLLLQQIAGYPVIDTGYLLLSRGVGSVLGLLFMARLRGRTDPRPILVFGILITAYAAWSMSTWTADVRAWDVVWTNFLHGVATGFIWAPLNILALSRLDTRVQDQGFSMFYLNFDVGYSIGTAVVIGMHARHSQINRAILAEHVSPGLANVPLPDQWSLTDPAGLAAIQFEVERQATMIAFNNSFMISAIALVVLIPFIFVFRFKPVES